MSITAEQKSVVIKQSRTHEKDTGSPDVQISVLTERIRELNEHLKDNLQDFSSRRGLLMMVSKRNRLLRYLARTDRDRYQALIQRLGLRK